jgi:hydroxymethylpyrimidine/phosphomethylpyrimidine kinase
MKKVLLSAAGYDPSGGAGVLLDVKVFQHFGFCGAGIVTAVTIQNTQSVKYTFCPQARILKDQYEMLAKDLVFSGIKVGMAGSRENVKIIGKILAANKNIPRVIDPVFRSSSGAWLLGKNAIPSFIREIRGRASILTPNLEEAGLITGRKVKSIEDMKEAAEKIYVLTRIPCLIKGGHLVKEAVNLLYDGRRTFLFGNPKINKDVHGTGCFFSSSLLCYLALGKPLGKACELATELTFTAIKTAVRIGRGRHVISFPASAHSLSSKHRPRISRLVSRPLSG